MVRTAAALVGMLTLAACDPGGIRHRRNSSVQFWVRIAVIMTVLPLGVWAQDDTPDQEQGNLTGGELLISAGVGAPYGFNAVGAAVNVDYIIGVTDIGLPLAFGVGAAGSALFYGSDVVYRAAGQSVNLKSAYTAWLVGVDGTVFLGIAPTFDLYSRLGVGYASITASSSVDDNNVLGDLNVGGFAFFGAIGAELFLADWFAIYVEGQLAGLVVGVRAKF